MERKVICALDTPDLEEALATAKRLAPFVGAFKIGHALTLPHGLQVLERFQDIGISRIFLDLKFHDIPNSVALAVREAARYKVWMMTLHIAGGPAMISAAVEEARMLREEERPILIGVSVLTSIDDHTLRDHLGVQRTVEDQMVELSKLGTQCRLDGVVSSPQEVAAIRTAIGHESIIVVPGIRIEGAQTHDQRRVGTAQSALTDGANYVVIGRTLVNQKDPEQALTDMGLNVGAGR